jgi:NAD-dependent DNA ligase
MLREGSDLEKVLKHLRRGKIDALIGQIGKIVEALSDKNLVDSLKGVFTLTVDVGREIESTRKDIESILKSIRQSD